ncbi:MAG: YtxH domain-containing protein [Clostridia bacterium]|nr:YtxH domain-containing protein [Clostridia bacterium]
MMNISAGFFKGMATGLVVGAAVTMMTDPMSDKQRKKIVKKTEGVFKNIGSVVDTAMNIMH